MFSRNIYSKYTKIKNQIFIIHSQISYVKYIYVTLEHKTSHK